MALSADSIGKFEGSTNEQINQLQRQVQDLQNQLAAKSRKVDELSGGALGSLDQAPQGSDAK